MRAAKPRPPKGFKNLSEVCLKSYLKFDHLLPSMYGNSDLLKLYVFLLPQKFDTTVAIKPIKSTGNANVAFMLSIPLVYLIMPN